MTKKHFLAVAMAVLMAAGSLFAQNNPKREFRSAWIATVSNIDWPKQKGTSAAIVSQQKADLVTMIDRMKELNMTTVCFQVRSMCDAMYKSSYEPWASYLTGTRGLDPGWDPLAFAVEECHKRGIEVYAWVNPYRWASSGDSNTWNTEFDQEVKNKGWLITNGTFTVLNPGLPETREHIVKVCKEIITNYSVEGLIFDDYFYPVGGTSEKSDAPDYALWKSSNSDMTIGDWRRDNVNKMVRDVYNMVQETRPEVRFGIAPPGTAGASASKYGLSMCPAGYDGQYTSLYSDPLYWMANHIVDYMSPQVYWHNDHSMAKFGPLANWWYGCAAKLKNVHCNMSVNIYDLIQSMGYQADLGNTEAHYKEHATNIKQSRQYAASNGVKAFGSNLYSIQYLCGSFKAHGDYLAQNCFQTKALVPVVDWKQAKSYNAVTNLAYTDGKLSWDPVTDGKTTIRYSVYAIPTSVSEKAAMANDGDGFDAKYLQGVTYLPNFAISSNQQVGHWYAVCVYDGYGNEHPAAITDFDYNGPEPGADGEFYGSEGTLTVKSIWSRTVENGGISFTGGIGNLNRAFCAVGDYVYIAGRESNSSTAAAYLRKINGTTGEIIGDIKLGVEASGELYPCNDVIKDQSGNVCITNLTANAQTTPLRVHLVNIETGALTEIASLKITKTIPAGTYRIDHAAILGDVLSGDFAIYAAVSSTASVVRWTFTGGKQTNEEVSTVTKLYPETATDFGSAPRVVPVTSYSYFIDGSNIAWSRYVFSSGTLQDSFTEKASIAPTSFWANGGTFFTLNKKYFITYSSADQQEGFKFNVAYSTNKNMGFDTMNYLWTLPRSGMGTVASGTGQASADYVQVNDATIRIFYYIPGVGINAYDLVDSAVSGVEETVAGGVTISAAGNIVKVSEAAQNISVYNMMGAQVASVNNAAELEVNAPAGIYIAVASVNGKSYKQKVVLK